MRKMVFWWQGSPGPPLLLAVFLHLVVHSDQDYVDHTGTQFMVTFIENRFLEESCRQKVFITAATDETASVNIAIPNSDYPDVSLTVVPGSGVEHSFDYVDYELHLMENGLNFKRLVVVQSDVPVVVEAANLNDLSSDAYLVLPERSLGDEYVVMSYVFDGRTTGQQQGPSSFIIASKEEADVNIQVHFPDIQVVDIEGIENDIDGNTLERELLQYDTFLVRSKLYKDLTGTRITASRPVSVVAGSKWTSIGRQQMGDHLVENLPPVATWGTSFYTVPIANRTGGDIIRIVGHTEGTQVRVVREDPDNPDSVLATSLVLNDRRFVDIESPSAASLVIMTSRAVLVAQFCKSHSVDNYRNSDPFMALVPPSTQYTNLYTFMTVSTRSGQTSFSNFVNIACETSKVTGLRLNNLAITPDDLFWGWVSVPTFPMSVGTLSIANGTYSLTHTDPNVTFSAMLYGLKFQESYGLILGQRLRPLTYKENCLRLQTEFEDFFDNDCDGLFDEEIENGIDDDGDGLIDEDVFNDRMARPQDTDNVTLAPGNTIGKRNDSGEVITETMTATFRSPTTEGKPTTEALVASTEITAPVVTTEERLTTEIPSTSAPSTVKDVISTRENIPTTDHITTYSPTTAAVSTAKHTTAGEASTASVSKTTEAGSTLLSIVTSPGTTESDVTTAQEVTSARASTMYVTTEVVHTTEEGRTTPEGTTTLPSVTTATDLPTTIQVTPLQTTGPITTIQTTESPTTTQSAPTTELPTTTVTLPTTEPPTTHLTKATSELPTTSQAAVTTLAGSTAAETSTMPETTTENPMTTSVNENPSTVDPRAGDGANAAPSSTSTSARTTQRPDTSPMSYTSTIFNALGFSTDDLANTDATPRASTHGEETTTDTNEGHDLTTSGNVMSDVTTVVTSYADTVSPTPTEIAGEPLMLIIPFVILVGVPLLVFITLVSRSAMAASRGSRTRQVTPRPAPATAAIPPPAVKKYKPAVVDLR